MPRAVNRPLGAQGCLHRGVYIVGCTPRTDPVLTCLPLGTSQVSEHLVASTTYSDTVKAEVSCKCVPPHKARLTAA